MPRSVRARIEALVDEGLVSLALASFAFSHAKDPSANAAEPENFTAATDGVSAALRGVRLAIAEK